MSSPVLSSHSLFLVSRTRTSYLTARGHAVPASQVNDLPWLDRVANKTPDVFNLFPEPILNQDARSFKVGLVKTFVFIVLNIGVLGYFAAIAAQSTMQTIKVRDTSFASLISIAEFNPRCTCGTIDTPGNESLKA
jgi:hypothetical protein